MKRRGYKNFFGFHANADLELLRQLSGKSDVRHVNAPQDDDTYEAVEPDPEEVPVKYEDIRGK